MYNREELLKKLEERRGNQIDICNARPHDRVAYDHLRNVEHHLNEMKLGHTISDNKQFLVYEHQDYRSSGNNHSEVNKTPIFRCCEYCTQALLMWLRSENSGFMKVQGLYYSSGEDKPNLELNKKIVVYKGRSYTESMLDDELIVDSGFLD